MPTTLQFRRGTTTQNNAFTGSAGELSIDEQLDVIRVHDGSTAGGAMELTGNTASQTLTNKTLTSPVLNTATVGTSIVPSSADGATLGTASAEFSDLFLADGGTIQLGNDQDVTLTHVADTGVLVNSTRKIQFNDAAESIHSNGSRLVLTSNSVAFNMPTADGSSGQAMVTDASGNLSFAAAGATISSDTTTDTDFLIYFASSTSGALTAVKQDSGLIYNPSTGLLTSAAFSGSGASLSALNGSNISSGTVAAARVATLNQNTTGSAATLTTARTIGGVSFDGSANITLPGVNTTGNQNTSGSAATLTTPRAIALTGAVTGTANFDGSAGISIATTATSDPTITLTGAVTGAGTLTNLGDVSITTTATADPTLTINGDASGSATFTNLGNATLTLTVADDSHNHTIANIDNLQSELDGKLTAGATSGSGISGSASSGTFTVTSNATNSNTGSTIVFRDSSGNFSANVISATTTSARYADLAEKYISDTDYEEGTVLIFGGEKEVTECTAKYDKRIAGIVSTDPAYLMNSESSGINVGLIGRIPCKVVGEIRKGDLMVASDTPGHAEAWKDESNPMTGSVIGKSLEDKYGSATGVIEVVVGKI